jgi:hypothetical protein
MSMNEFRRLATKIDQHMQLLSAQGVNDAPTNFQGFTATCSDLHLKTRRPAFDALFDPLHQLLGWPPCVQRTSDRKGARVLCTKRRESHGLLGSPMHGATTPEPPKIPTINRRAA